MKLLTKEIERKFRQTPIGSTDGKGFDARVIAKFFNPYGKGTWIITEADEHDGDWMMYGYAKITDWEWGYVMLSELINARISFGAIGLKGSMPAIERDLYVNNLTVREALAVMGVTR